MPVGAGIASAAGSIGSGILQSNAAGSAAKAAQGAADKNNALAGQVYQTNTNNLQPYVGAGQSANTALSGLLGIGGDPAASAKAFQGFLGSTNYNFMLNQGLQGQATLNAPAYASGATSKALTNYAQGMAGNALSGYESALSGLSGQGLQAGSALGSLGTNYVSQESSNNNNAAGVTASADLAQGNAEANALSGVVRGLSGSASSFGNGSGSILSGFGGGGSKGGDAFSGMQNAVAY